MNEDGWKSPVDVTALVSELLPYFSSYYWVIAEPGDCGDLTGDGWKSPTDVSTLVSGLLPFMSMYYWVKCPVPLNELSLYEPPAMSRPFASPSVNRGACGLMAQAANPTYGISLSSGEFHESVIDIRIRGRGIDFI